MEFEIYDWNSIILGLLATCLFAECIILLVRVNSLKNSMRTESEKIRTDEKLKYEKKNNELEMLYKEREIELKSEYEDLLSMAKAAKREEEEKIMRLLASCGEAHVGEICAQTGIPVFRAGGLLSGLEIKGMVARAGGNRYAAVGSFLSAQEKETETNESPETSERQGVPRRAK